MKEFRCEITEYKGSPVFNIYRGDRRLFGFGLQKARAIVSLLEDIKKFIKDNEKDEE